MLYQLGAFKKLKNERGNLHLVLVVSLVILTGLFAMMSMTYTYQVSAQSTAKRLSVRNLESAVRLALDSTAICSCHFDPGINKDSAVVDLTLDPSGALPTEWDLTEIRSGCDFTSSSNVIASTTSADPLVAVDTIKVKDFSAGAGGIYSANVYVQSKANSKTQVSVVPSAIPIHFVVGPTASVPSPPVDRQPVQACVKTVVNVYRNECPPGFSLVGTKDTFKNFCIESKARAATGYASFVSGCAMISFKGFSRAENCDPGDWMQACEAGVDPDMKVQPEWTGYHWVDPPSTYGQVSSDGFAIQAGQSSCDRLERHAMTEMAFARCCIY